MVGSPAIVGITPGFGKSAGFFDYAVRLENPRVDELRKAFLQLREWLSVNQYAPEYASFQFNFAFSGHGTANGDGAAAVVLADGTLNAENLASMLLLALPKEETSPSSCRLDLFLDCCQSGAIAQALGARLLALQRGVDPQIRSRLNLGQVYCACLDEEESFEVDGVPHSVFTFAFLNECSRKRPDGSEFINLGLRDVG